MKLRMFPVIWLATVATLPSILGGCASAVAESTVNEDLSWNRKVSYVVGGDSMSSSPDSDQKKPAVKDQFIVPGTQGWKYSERFDEMKHKAIGTAERTYQAGEAPEPDIVIESKGKRIAQNSIKITKVGENRYVYEESIHWVGNPPGELGKIRSEVKASLVKAFPMLKLDDREWEAHADQVMKTFLQVVFGPSEPMLEAVLLEGDAGQKRFMRTLAVRLDEKLRILLPDLSDSDRRKGLKILLADDSMQLDPNKSSESSNAEESGNPVILGLSVKMPGEIVESNGLLDPVTGEVVWNLYPEGASLGDVTLRAVSEVKK